VGAVAEDGLLQPDQQRGLRGDARDGAVGVGWAGGSGGGGGSGGSPSYGGGARRHDLSRVPSKPYDQRPGPPAQHFGRPFQIARRHLSLVHCHEEIAAPRAPARLEHPLGPCVRLLEFGDVQAALLGVHGEPVLQLDKQRRARDQACDVFDAPKHGDGAWRAVLARSSGAVLAQFWRAVHRLPSAAKASPTVWLHL
jgi:hypothetical protein